MSRVKMLCAPLVAALLGCASLIAVDALAVTFSEQGATILGGYNATARSVSLADIDNDGDLDTFFQGGASSARQMFRNNLIETGSLTYTNITADWVPGGLGLVESWSAAWGDYNGDGRVDVFVGQNNFSPNVGDVLRNDGSGFSNQTTSTGLNDAGFHQNVGWIDIDNDRDLDLIIGQEGPELHQVYLQNYPGTPAGTFTPRGAQVGIQTVGTRAYGTAIGDTDGDGDFDMYISTCSPGGSFVNNFYKNMLVENGSLSFVDIANSNGTQYTVNSYGSEFHDFDNDGDLDLLVTGADGNKTKMFRNDGGNMFSDVEIITGHQLLRSQAGTNVFGIDLNGSKSVDYDNDGDLDLYFHDNLSSSPNHRLFENKGNWDFRDVTQTALLHQAAGGATVGVGGYDSAWGDLDRDGDQDLIVPNNSTAGVATPERVFISNASTNSNHWLYVELDGPSYNTSGIGASLFATINDGTPQEVTLRREANTNIGTFNQSDLPVHFGLGAATTIDELRIQWPDGTSQTYYDVPTDRYLTLQYLPGDFDGSGTVDAGDYIAWRKGLGPNDDGWDYNVWRSFFGQSLPGGGSGANASVPEPTSLWIIVAAAGAMLSRRSRVSMRT
jgi:enediyne biosynthesis protein E4